MGCHNRQHPEMTWDIKEERRIFYIVIIITIQALFINGHRITNWVAAIVISEIKMEEMVMVKEPFSYKKYSAFNDQAVSVKMAYNLCNLSLKTVFFFRKLDLSSLS